MSLQNSDLIILCSSEWQLHGHWQDRTAWQGLTHTIGREELVRQLQVEGGKMSKGRRFSMPRESVERIRAKLKAKLNCAFPDFLMVFGWVLDSL